MISPVTAGVILVVALIVFGPGKLPEVGRAIGKGIKAFKSETSGGDDDAQTIATPKALATGAPSEAERRFAARVKADLAAGKAVPPDDVSAYNDVLARLPAGERLPEVPTA